MNATWKKRTALAAFFIIFGIIIWLLWAKNSNGSKNTTSGSSGVEKVEITVHVVGCGCGHHAIKHYYRPQKTEKKALPPLPEIKKISQSAPPPERVEAKVEPQVVIIERTRTRVIHEEEPVENEYRQARPRYNNYDEGYYPPQGPTYYYVPSEPRYYEQRPPRYYHHYSEPPHVWGGGGRVWNSPRSYGGPQNPPLGGGSYGGPRNPPMGGGGRGMGGGPSNPPMGGRAMGGGRSFGHR